MDLTFREFIQMLFTVVAGGVTTYVAIRIDLAVQRAQLVMHDLQIKEAKESASEAHTRIDGILLDRRKS